MCYLVSATHSDNKIVGLHCRSAKQLPLSWQAQQQLLSSQHTHLMIHTHTQTHTACSQLINDIHMQPSVLMCLSLRNLPHSLCCSSQDSCAIILFNSLCDYSFS